MRLVIHQTKKQYYNEMYHRFRFIWWIIASLLFTLIFWGLIESSYNRWYLFLGFLALFVISDFTGNAKVKAYMRITIGVLYFIWGLIFIISSLFLNPSDKDMLIPGIAVGFIFIYLSYKSVKDNSNLFDVLSILLHKRKIESHHGSHNQPKQDKLYGNNSPITDFFIWFATFSVGVFLSMLLLPFIQISNKLIMILFSGLIIELVSKIMQIFVYYRVFVVNKRFFFWVVMQSLCYFIASSFQGKPCILLFLMSSS